MVSFSANEREGGREGEGERERDIEVRAGRRRAVSERREGRKEGRFYGRLRASVRL